jgi:hypothetical protein
MLCAAAGRYPGDDVPADAAGEVIERGKPSCERVGMLETRSRRDAEPEVVCDQRHRREKQQRVADRDLRACRIAASSPAP